MMKVGGSIAAIRIATIVLRFGLTIFITSQLGLEAMGQFGLILGLGVLAPALLGLGLNFTLAHAVVGASPALQYDIFRQRRGFALVLLFTVSAIGIPAALAFTDLTPWQIGLVALVVWGEVLGADAYIMLTIMHANVLANISIAIRSALWIPVAMALGFLDPAFRNLETILLCWIAGQLVNVALVYTVIGRRLQGELPATVEPRWVARNMRSSLRIWPSDIALVLISMGDRFVLAGTVSAVDLGIFVFYWSFANALQTLVQAALISPALPRLIASFRKDIHQWLHSIRKISLLIGGLGMFVGAGIYLFVWFGHRYVPQANFPWAPIFGALIIIASIARLLGDFLSTALNSAKATSAYVGFNLAFAGMLMAALVPAASFAGITGAASALLVLAMVFNVMKLAALRLIVKSRVSVMPADQETG